MARKLRTAARILREEGINGVVTVLATQYGWPILWGAKSRWRAGIKSELLYWESCFRSGGADSDAFEPRCDPERALQPRVVALLPPQEEVSILDVGAGPLTWLGTKCPGRRVRITAIDPLADHYDRLLRRYGIQPPVRTRKAAAERLRRRFPANTFDLVFARNCIDHAFNPERAILEMIRVVKPGGTVLMEHRPDEAEREGYYGLHQWNFSMNEDGDFVIRSRDREVNMTRKHAHRCAISCELALADGDGGFLVTTIRKPTGPVKV